MLVPPLRMHVDDTVRVAIPHVVLHGP